MRSGSSMRVAVGYAIGAVVYLFLSDSIVHLLQLGDDIEFEIGLVKGLGFVVVTALLLFGLLLRHQRGLERMDRLRRMLVEVGRLVAMGLDRDALFDGVCKAAVSQGGFRAAWIGIVDSNGKVRLATRCAVDGGGADLVHAHEAFLNAGGPGPACIATSPGGCAWAGNLRTNPALAPLHDAAGLVGIQAAAAHPLREHGEVIGALFLYSECGGFFNHEVLETLERLAGDLSFGLDQVARRHAVQTATAVIESSPVVLFRWRADPGWPIEFVSQNVQRWGYRPASLMAGQPPFSALVHPGDLDRVMGEVRRHTDEGQVEFEQSYRLITASGEERWVEDRTTVERDAQGRVLRYQGAIADVTQRRAVERELKESELRYRALVEQSLAGIYMIDDGRVIYMNRRAAEIFGYAASEVIGMPIAEFVLERDRPLVMENLRRRMDGEIASIQYEFQGVRKDGKQVLVGVHGTVAQVQGRRVILGVLQDITEKRLTEETIRDYVARLESAVLGTAAAVSQMVELRDPYTAGHERRVGELSAAIAAEMGSSEDMQRGLRVAGAVHDVGKIMVPAEILAKPGRLTAVEFELVKQHAQQGYEVLKDVAFPWPVAEVARQHHERLDGSGYPRGLKGGDILPEARILAVADVVESMSSHRPYRPGLGLARALQEVESNSGRLYDPKAVAACLRLFRDKGYAIPD
ncbi:MAG: HD domain-containing phosphohydrolase [Betaproteobacteria bacterium]